MDTLFGEENLHKSGQGQLTPTLSVFFLAKQTIIKM